MSGDANMDVDVECAYCVDGMRPCAGGEGDNIGPHFHACTHCQSRCRWCDGTSWFPADHDNLIEYMKRHLDQGDIPIVCMCCLGVIGVLEA